MIPTDSSGKENDKMEEKSTSEELTTEIILTEEEKIEEVTTETITTEKATTEESTSEEMEAIHDIGLQEYYVNEGGELYLAVEIQTKDKNTYSVITNGDVLGNYEQGYHNEFDIHPIDEDNTYVSDDGRFKILVMGNSIEITDNVSSAYMFDGVFVTVEEYSENQIIQLNAEELRAFLRDDDNIGKTIEIVLRYGSKYPLEYGGKEYHHLGLMLQDESMVSIAVSDIDSSKVFYHNEFVRFVGTYMGYLDDNAVFETSMLESEDE